MNVRDTIADFIVPLLPSTWKVVPYSTNLDVLDTVVVMFKQTSVERLMNGAGRVRNSYLHSITCTVIDPHQDLKRSQDALDDELMQVLIALDGYDNLWWEDANSGNYNAEILGYDISIKVISTKAVEPPAPTILAKGKKTKAKPEPVVESEEEVTEPPTEPIGE